MEEVLFSIKRIRLAINFVSLRFSLKLNNRFMKRINFAYFILSLLFCSCETNVRNPDTDQEEEPITFQAENGILPSIFSISDSTTIHFSQGNLQYQASTNTWRFAEHQIDIIGADNIHIIQSTSNDKWIDLFGWATSGFNNTNLDSLAINYQPWAISNEYNSNLPDNPFGYGFSLFFLDSIDIDSINIELTIDFSIDSTNYDWGIYNAITNGGGQDSIWRTLTAEEWNYLIFKRNNAENLYGVATINGVNGVILLPDNWISPRDIIFKSGMGDAFGNEYFTKNNYNTNKWNKMQLAGAVFLPACGYRNGTEIGNINITGAYWTTTCKQQNNPEYLYFYSNYISLTNGYNPYYGQAVRLVCE